MLRGRIGGDGAPFNLGEATVTRARRAAGERRGRLRLCARTRSRESAADRALRRAGAAEECQREAVEQHVLAPIRQRLQRRARNAGANRPPPPRSTSSRWCGGGLNMTARRLRRIRCSQPVGFRADARCHGAAGQRSSRSRSRGRPPPLSAGAAAIALTLCDHDTPVWLDRDLRSAPRCANGCAFHCGCPSSTIRATPPLLCERPARTCRRSTTSTSARRTIPTAPPPSCCRSRSFRRAGLALTGPGIRGPPHTVARDRPAARISRRGSSPTARCFRAASICCWSTGNAIAALPRSVRVVERPDRCTSRSKAARRRSRTRTGCWRRAARRSDGPGAVARRRSQSQLTLAVDRVMAEGSLYDRDLAALAIKQARGDLIEAIFLLRAYRTTLPRFGASEPVDTADMHGAPPHFRDLQGPAGRPDAGADLRLHPPAARPRPRRGAKPPKPPRARGRPTQPMPRVTDLLAGEGLIEPSPQPRRRSSRSAT